MDKSGDFVGISDSRRNRRPPQRMRISCKPHNADSRQLAQEESAERIVAVSAGSECYIDHLDVHQVRRYHYTILTLAQMIRI